MIEILLLRAALAKDDFATQAPIEAEQVFQAQQVADISDTVGELAAMLAHTRDAGLVSQGYAPEGWVQPSLEVYEATLNGRPSLLPIESIEKATVDEKIGPEILAQYEIWKIRQESPVETGERAMAEQAGE